MRFWQRAGLALLLCAVCTIGFFGRALAETITVTIGVGDTILTVTGKTSPNAFVTILKDAAVIGTTTAAADGTYTRTFPAQSPGLHAIDIYANSVSGVNTDTVTLNINITEHATTTVEVFLPTTLVVEDTTLEPSQTLHLSGETFPLSSVNVFIDNTDFVTVLADSQGNWTAQVTTAPLSGGQHEFFVRAIDSLGNQSYPTAMRFFTLAIPPGLPTPPTPIEVPPVPSITFPISNTIWEQPQITITGQAKPHVQIELWDGTQPLGAAWSDAKGEWALTVLLEAKEYHLRARACLRGQCSVFSREVILTHRPASGVQPGTGQGLIITLPTLSFFVFEDTALIIRPTIVNGQPPYQVKIDWGDGSSGNDTLNSGRFSIGHAYSTPGKYTATLSAYDTQGLSGSLQFTVEVLPNAGSPWPLLLFMLALLFIVLLLAYFIRRPKGGKKEKSTPAK